MISVDVLLLQPLSDTETLSGLFILNSASTSQTLAGDGKMQIRGTYLASRSSGVDRVQGVSIELN